MSRKKTHRFGQLRIPRGVTVKPSMPRWVAPDWNPTNVHVAAASKNPSPAKPPAERGR